MGLLRLLLWAAAWLGSAAVAAPAPDAGPGPAPWLHAFAVFGEPKYAVGFAHYDYVNPAAPKGGTLNLSNPDRRSSFTRLNPYILKGSGAFGAEFFCFETLFDPSQDEAGVMYGLVAQALQVAPDLSTVTVRVHPKARFNNGDPVTAADVKYSFDTLSSDRARPESQAMLSVVRRAIVVDPATVRFEMAQRSRDAVYTLGTYLQVFSPKWGADAQGRPRPFDQIILDPPITTGAYKVERNYSGRRLDLVRNPDYWARDEGVRRGFFNFDKVVYRYYADNAVQLEALKAGDIDLFWETNLKRWGRQLKGPRFGPGKIITRAFPSGQGTYMRSLMFNLRRPQFQDIRVREALQLSFDFEWLNAQSFNLFARVDSAFSNSEFAARGLPSATERALLEPFRDRLPAAVFGPAYQNPRTDTGPTALRDNLKRARDLLQQAGWRLGTDRQLRDARGRPFTLELLNNDADIAASLEPWLANLAKLGIAATIRQVDFAVFAKRLEAFDFDITQLNQGEFLMPSPALIKSFYASDQADKEGSENYGGVRDPALDATIAAMEAATTLPQLRDAARAFDRVFMHQRYVIPWSRRPAFNAAWWDRLGMPARTPRYFTLTALVNNASPWPISTWWSEPAASGGGGAGSGVRGSP
jgi:peptide/nickel transport system substrate-binding protein/microcin C transport system substrate-binding protein